MSSPRRSSLYFCLLEGVSNPIAPTHRITLERLCWTRAGGRTMQALRLL